MSLIHLDEQTWSKILDCLQQSGIYIGRELECRRLVEAVFGWLVVGLSGVYCRQAMDAGTPFTNPLIAGASRVSG
jgi:hypothetical protein